jgi:hypothetical protein
VSEWGDWAFESTITAPDGVRVHVTVTVPSERVWKDMPETAELAQMAASRGMKMVQDSQTRAPF